MATNDFEQPPVQTMTPEQIDAELAQTADLSSARLTSRALQRRGMLRHLRGERTTSVEDMRAARMDYEAALLAGTETAVLLRAAAAAAWALGDRKASFDYMERARLVAPDDPVNHSIFFRMCYTLRNTPRAGPAADALERGFGLLRGGRPDDAIAALQEAVQLSPDYEIALVVLGITCVKQAGKSVGSTRRRNLKIGLPALESAVALNHGEPLSLYYLANCRSMLGDLPGAINAAERCIEFDPAFGRARATRSAAYLKLAARSALSLRLSQALEHLNKMGDPMLGTTQATPFGQFYDAKEKVVGTPETLSMYQATASPGCP